jgi:hypothetical protein
MPERLDHVTVALSRGDVTIALEERQALSWRLSYVGEPAEIRTNFDAVGATRPVELNHGQRTALFAVLNEWSAGPEGYEPMPPGLHELRDALALDTEERPE